MIYIKSNEHNITNNYNDKVKMILRSRLQANKKYVVTLNSVSFLLTSQLLNQLCRAHSWLTVHRLSANCKKTKQVCDSKLQIYSKK